MAYTLTQARPLLNAAELELFSQSRTEQVKQLTPAKVAGAVKRTRTAAKRTSTTTRKAAAKTTTAAKGARTSATKTATATKKAAATTAAKVGD